MAQASKGILKAKAWKMREQWLMVNVFWAKVPQLSWHRLYSVTQTRSVQKATTLWCWEFNIGTPAIRPQGAGRGAPLQGHFRHGCCSPQSVLAQQGTLVCLVSSTRKHVQKTPPVCIGQLNMQTKSWNVSDSYRLIHFNNQNQDTKAMMTQQCFQTYTAYKQTKSNLSSYFFSQLSCIFFFEGFKVIKQFSFLYNSWTFPNLN